MSTSGPQSKSGLVMELAEEFLERHRAGERPSVGEYVARHPELASEIREVFPAMAMMENIAIADEPQDGEATGARRPASLPPLERLGDFRILREIGHGGMGVVYEAEQVSLGRQVALKVLPASMLRDEKHRRRFEREAKAAAKLHHTNIVPVFGVGEHEGTPFYAMQYIQGSGLDSVLEELKRLRTGEKPREKAGSLTRSDVAPARLTAADAARSLMTGRLETVAAGEPDPEATVAATPAPGSKPEPPRSSEVRPTVSASASSSSVSILAPGSSDDRNSRVRRSSFWRAVARIGVQVAEALDYAHRQGVVHRDVKPSNLLLDARGTVWVADFGLAKADDQQNLTHTGDILGTLRYMPPEAFEGKTDRLGDVYSLGLTLYEMLAFRPAFDEKDRGRLIRQVTGEPPPPLRRLNPEVPRDLETIVHKAIERDPSHRYATSGELAEDLRRFVDDEPIRARRIPFWERGVKWAKRRPVIAGLLALVQLLLAVAFGVFVWSYFKINESLADARSARDLAQHLAKTERLASDEAKAQTKVATERAEDLAWQDYVNRVNRADFEIDRDNIALAEDLLHGCPPERRGWEWHYVKRRCRSERLTIEATKQSVNVVAFSPDGRAIVTGASYSIHGMGNAVVKSVVDVWDRATGRRLKGWTRKSVGIFSIAFSPDGKRIAMGGSLAEIEVRDFETGTILWSKSEADAPLADAFSVAFSPDGATLAAGYGAYSSSTSYPVKLYDAKTGEERFSIPGRPGGTHDTAFHPDGRRVASAAAGVVEVWDVVERRRVQELKGHDRWIYALAYSPDGKWLASGGWDGTIKLRDAATGEERLTLRGHEGFVTDLAFGPDGRVLASTSEDRSVRLWGIPGGRLLGGLHGHTDFTLAVAVSPDGREVASGSLDGTLKLWDRKTSLPVVLDLPAPSHMSVFSHDGRRLLVLSSNVLSKEEPGRIESTIWNVSNGALEGKPKPEEYEALKNEYPIELTGRHWRRDPRRFRPVDRDRTRIAWVLGSDDPALRANLGRAADHFNNAVELLDFQTGERRAALVGHTAPVVQSMFSPDGTRIATASNDRTIKLWNAATGREVFTLRGHVAGVTGLNFSPDGHRLASTGFESTARVWDATPLPKETLARDEARHLERRKSLKVDPTQTQRSELSWAFTLEAVGEIERAVALRSRILSSAPEDPRLWIGLAYEAKRSGDVATLNRIADALLARAEKDKSVEVAMRTSMILEFADRSRDAMRLLAPVVEREPENPRAWSAYAMALHKENEAETLRRAAETVHARFGENWSDPVTGVQLGTVYAAAEWWDRFIKIHEKIIGSFPPFAPSSRISLQYGLFLAGRTREAVAARDEAVKRLGDFKQSRSAYFLAHIVATTPSADPESNLAVARACFKKAAPEYEKQELLAPLGVCCYRAGRYEEAVEHLERVETDKNLTYPKAMWAYLAMAHHRLGHAEKARTYLEKLRESVKAREDSVLGLSISERLLTEAEAVVQGK